MAPHAANCGPRYSEVVVNEFLHLVLIRPALFVSVFLCISLAQPGYGLPDFSSLRKQAGVTAVTWVAVEGDELVSIGGDGYYSLQEKRYIRF